ncbi:MAG: hypothetical protein HYS77_13710, partial [Candidatus Rokubacteria bacterium]|nr:hypothetical protein [Candidatus Rokubacteria bacterium]
MSTEAALPSASELEAFVRRTVDDQLARRERPGSAPKKIALIATKGTLDW